MILIDRGLDQKKEDRKELCDKRKRAWSVALERRLYQKYSVELSGNNAEVTPVPIPNTEVKLRSADDTWWVTARESRSLLRFTFLNSSVGRALGC